jgi:hypothetical protein
MPYNNYLPLEHIFLTRGVRKREGEDGGGSWYYIRMRLKNPKHFIFILKPLSAYALLIYHCASLRTGHSS